jgi:hypothetical protein
MTKCRVESKMEKAERSEAVGVVALAFMKGHRFRTVIVLIAVVEVGQSGASLLAIFGAV